MSLFRKKTALDMSAQSLGVALPESAPDVVATTDAVSQETSGASLPNHTTHGAVFNGPLTSVNQLYRDKVVTKGAPESFDSVGDYSNHLSSLSLSDLHFHAIAQKETPIGDRAILIRRLESKWSSLCMKAGKATARGTGPKAFTAEQRAAQEAIKRKMLRR